MDFIDFNSLQVELSVFLRIFAVIILAGILGWERESAGKAAGLRTHILVGIGSLLFLVLSEMLVDKYRSFDQNLRFDPIRVIEAVVTGISFLGAGTIFVSRGEKERVEGLTTAASILTTAAVGLIIGLERYFLAVGSTIIIFAVLRILTVAGKSQVITQPKENES